jgi:hypothetical protein
MATPPVQTPDWISEYKAALPKTKKDADKVRRNLWWVIGSSVVAPLIVLLVALISTDRRVVTNATVAGLIDAFLIISLFMGLRLYERNPGVATLRAAAFVLCSSALPFIDTRLVVALFTSGDYSTVDTSVGEVLSSALSGSLWLIAVVFILRRRSRFFERGKVTAMYLPITREVAKEFWFQIDELTKKAATLGLPPRLSQHG